MAFQLSDAENKDKVFLVKQSALEDRLDPYYYTNSFYELTKRLLAGKYPTTRLKDLLVLLYRYPTFYDIDYKKVGVPVLKIENITKDGFLEDLNSENYDYIDEEISNKFPRTILDKDDLVMAVRGATIGKMAVVTNEFVGSNINANLIKISLAKNQILPSFFWIYFNTKIGQKLFYRNVANTAKQTITVPQIKNLLIPLPPVDIQKQIVAKMSTAYGAKKQKEAQAQQLLDSIDAYLLNELGIKANSNYQNSIENRIVKSSFRSVTGQRWDPLFHCGDMFSFVRKASPHIDLQQLNNLVMYFQTGFAAGRDDQGEEHSGIIQIRPTNINDNRELVFHRNVYIDASELNTRKSDVLNRDEVLFNNTNSQEQVGKTTYFGLEGDYFCSNHITRIATKAELLNPKYLCYILNLYQHQKCFFKLCTNWNNQSGVGVDVLQKIPIPLPSLEKQNEIAAHIQAIRDQAKQLRTDAAAGLEQAKQEVEAMIIGKEATT